jgi:ABC-2 type transport system permease protein
MLFELRKHVRRRRMLIALLLSTLVPLIFYAVPMALDRDFPSTSSQFARSNLGFVSLLVLISAAFFGGDAISSEVDKRTFLVSYVAPHRRTSMFAGKFLAAFVATAAMASIYYLITLSEIQAVYGLGDVPAALPTSFAVAVLYSLAALSVAFTFSALMKSTITSNLLSFFMLLLVLPIISGVLSIAGVDPWLVPTYYSSLISSVFGGPSDSVGGGGGGGPGAALASFSPDFHTGLAVVSGWSVALLLFSALVTSWRQME